MAWDKEIEQLHHRRELAEEQGGEVNVGRQHKAGRLTVRERIDYLVDESSFQEIGKTTGGVDSARRTTRSVYFAESKGFVDCPVYDRYKLSNGDVLEGPAIIEEMDSTTIIHPRYKADVDRYGNVFLSGV